MYYLLAPRRKGTDVGQEVGTTKGPDSKPEHSKELQFALNVHAVRSGRPG